MEEQLGGWKSKADGLPASSRQARYLAEAAAATDTAIRILVKLETSVVSRKGHERLAMPGKCLSLCETS